MAGPVAVRVFRTPAVHGFVDVELDQKESSARIAKAGVQAGATPDRHMGPDIVEVGFAKYGLDDKPAIGAVVEDWGDRQREDHGAVLVARQPRVAERQWAAQAKEKGVVVLLGIA